MRGWTRISPMSSHQARLTPSLIMTFLLGVFFGTITLAYGGPFWSTPLVLIIFGIPFLLSLRAMRAGVYASKERVRVRSLWRTRTVPLTAISSVTSAPRRGDPEDPMRSDVLQIALKNGETIRTSVRIRNPLESAKAIGAIYDRDEYRRIKDHLGALVSNQALDDAAPPPQPKMW